ncbi:hypothetical protein [Qipengyuania sp. 902]|uniref:hypothetical protein n=1 Tax=Qipengyuania sp. 902 TaxID=3417565 RepID=UPI003EBF77E1
MSTANTPATGIQSLDGQEIDATNGGVLTTVRLLWTLRDGYVALYEGAKELGRELTRTTPDTEETTQEGS